MIIRHVFSVLCLTASLVLPPAQAQSPSASTSRHIERLTIADEQGDHGLPSPFTHAADGVGFVLTTLAFDSLLWRDRTGKLIPALAVEWKESTDHRAVEFVLRPESRWHDGKPVTAADVAFTFDYFRRHPHPFLDVGAVAGADDLGDGRVRVRLKRVYAPFVPQLAGALPILPRHVFDRLDDPRRLRMAEIVGSGPYRVTGYDKAGGRYRFSANDDYYLGRPRVRELVFVRMEPALALGALKRGEVDMIRSLPLPLLPEAERFATVVKAQSGHPIRLRFNHARPPFDDKRLRQAFAHAIDRDELLRVVEGGLGEVSAGRFLRNSPWQTGTPLAAYAFDLSAARRALEEHGFAADAQGRLHGRNGKPLTVELAAARNHARLASALAGQLEKLGVAVEVRIVDGGILAARIGSDDFDLALVTQGSNGDPESMTRQMVGTAPFSDAFRRREDLVDLLARQVATADTDERRDLLDRAQAIYADELPAFYLYSPLWATAANSKLRPWFTPGGFAFGIPLPLNKLMFVQ
ncbi:MAG: hypothetical protein H3C26_04395 [Rhodocyclaceae bacterium]|nr:hypothetical protein [Rhodocyclaceae bacterium]